MAITRYLTSQPYVNAGDQVIILAERNGDMRRTSVAAISDFVKAAISAGGGSGGGGGTPSWGSIVGNISAQADLAAQLANKQPLLPTGGTSTNFLRGDGVWAVPAGGGSSAATWGSITGTLSSQTDLMNALNGKENALPVGTSVQYLRGNKTLATLDKAAVGLSNVDNTSDAAKPVGTATQSALDAKEPTIAPGNTTQYWRGDKTWQTLPTGGSGAAWGSITGALASQTDLNSALAGKEPSITATSTSQYFRGDKTFQTLDKSAVGLNNVDNTADTAKPVSGPQATAIGAKENTLPTGTTSQYLRGDKTMQALNAGAVGLGNVNNTSDAAKPISTATQSALDAKAPLASPALTGIPTVPTAAVGTNTTQAASTAFVLANAGTGGGGFANPMTTAGDLIVGGTGGTPTRAGAGTNNYVLTSNGPGAAPTWKVPTGAGASNANSVSYDGIRGPSRSQLAKNRETVSIYDFGAIGTGTFDNNPLSTRYATLQDAQNAYPTLTNLSLSDQIDWAALQSGVDYMQSTGKILDLAGARLCVNRETIFRNAGFIFIKGSRAEIGGKRMAKAWIDNGSSVAVDNSYPTNTDPGPVGGCCFYAATVPYYAYIEDINFNDFRFGIAFFNDPNSPIFKNCNFNYTNCGVIYYLGCQNPRYVNCGGGQLGVLHVSSVTAFPSGHPYIGNDNYYSDNVTITNEVGYASIGSQPSAGFDNFLRDSILRPTVDSTTAAGTRKYSDKNNVTYTDPFFLNATGRICYMPFRNLRDCFSFTMHADSRGGLRYGYALVNTEIAALELYANNYEQLFQALPDSDTTASLLTCGSVFSGTMRMASQIDYIEKAHPMVAYTGRGQSRGFTDGGGITLLGTSIIARKGDKFLGFNNGVLQANRQFMGIDEFTQGRTQGRADANAPADFTWYLNGRETFTNVYPGRMMIESNPLIIDLPFKTADNVRRVNALVNLNMGFAGYLKATVFNANSNIPVDSAVYYWDSLPSESFTLNQAVNNTDPTVVLSGTPNGNYSSPRFSKWTFDAQSPKGFLMDGYLSGTTVQPLGAISGLSGTVASGTVVRRSEKLQVIRAFSQSWIRIGIFNSTEGTVPFHGAGSLGIRNLLAGDTAPNDSPELRVTLTLHHMYPG